MAEKLLVQLTETELTELIRREVSGALKQFEPTPVHAPREGNYTSKDLQELFKVSPVTIFNWERKSILKPVIVSRRKMYLKEDIDALIQQKQMKQRK